MKKNIVSTWLLRSTLLILLLFSAHAQTAKTRSTLYGDIDTNLPSSTGAITAAVLRSQLKDIVASAFNTVNADAQPIDADLTAIAAVPNQTAFGRGLLAEVSAATLKTTLSLVKGDVGLSNVDNTSDAAKPVSAATATALAGKADSSHTHTLSQILQSGATTNQIPQWNGTEWVPATIAGGGGSGTVTTISVATANGVSGSVANATTTPVITFTLGAITPTSVNGITLSGSATPTLAVTGTTAVSGTNTGDNAVNSLYSGLVTNATHTGDATGATVLTLATVNSNVGSFGGATSAPTFTVNSKGLITAAGSTTITPAVGSITGFGTGVAGALALSVGSAGAPVVYNGAGGTPSSINLTNATGFPTLNQSTTGNAGSATILQTTRTIGGSNFNGSANVTSFPAPGPIGGTTPSSGAFTTITASSMGTIGGVQVGAVNGTPTDGYLDEILGIQGRTAQDITIASSSNNSVILNGVKTKNGGVLAGFDFATVPSTSGGVFTVGGATATSAPAVAWVTPSIATTATTYYVGIYQAPSIVASANVPSIWHNIAAQGTKGAGATIGEQVGFMADTSLTGATLNYGFQGKLAAATGRYNLYMSGTAPNYFAGVTILPPAAMAGTAIDVTRSLNTYSATAPATLSYSNATPEEGTNTLLRITADGTDRTITIPPTWSHDRKTNITSLLVQASTTLQVRLQYLSSRWEIFGDPVDSTGTGSFVRASALNPASVALGAGLVLDWSLGDTFTKTITGSTSFSFSNTSEKTIVFALTNGATGSVTFTGVTWPAGTAPTPTANKTDVYTFKKIGAVIYGNAVTNF